MPLSLLAERPAGNYPVGMGMCNYPGCRRESWPSSQDGSCFFHCDDNGSREDDARKLWDEARRLASEGGCDFVGWHFPECPDRTGFEGCELSGADFSGAVFQDANFTGSRFAGPARFDGADFRGSAFFGQACWSGSASFRQVKFETLAGFDDARFESSAAFDAASFQTTANFAEARFDGQATFTGAAFGGLANFDHCTFTSVRFGQATFNLATFRSACFGEEAYFRQARFVQGDFRHAIFRDCEFSGVVVEDELIFSPPSPPLPFVPARPFRPSEHGEVPYRLAKQAAQARGDYRSAGEYHYAEQCAIESARRSHAQWRPWRGDFWNRHTNILWCWFEFLLARALFGYGERPARVLLAGMVVVVLWAGMFYAFQGMGPGELTGGDLACCRVTFPECLHFSVVTFTTVGYGDFKPKPSCRFLADSEAVLGAALMAMFVVALTRKYMR